MGAERAIRAVVLLMSLTGCAFGAYGDTDVLMRAIGLPDVVVHFAVFAALGAGLSLTWSPAWEAAGLGFLLPLVTEIGQAFVPWHEASVTDLVAGMPGVALSSGTVVAVQKQIRARTPTLKQGHGYE